MNTTERSRPIDFNAFEVNATLEDRKSQFRRPNGFGVINEQPEQWSLDGFEGGIASFRRLDGLIVKVKSPYGVPGDLLWVREKLVRCQDSEGSKPLALYDWDRAPVMRFGEPAEWRWKRDTLSSINMPRWASRILLRAKGVRVERVQEISEEDAIAEGCVKGHMIEPGTSGPSSTAKQNFGGIWDYLYLDTPFAWERNPWVWAVTFEKVTP
jgi:hypothetical protein